MVFFCFISITYIHVWDWNFLASGRCKAVESWFIVARAKEQLIYMSVECRWLVANSTKWEDFINILFVGWITGTLQKIPGGRKFSRSFTRTTWLGFSFICPPDPFRFMGRQLIPLSTFVLDLWGWWMTITNPCFAGLTSTGALEAGEEFLLAGLVCSASWSIGICFVEYWQWHKGYAWLYLGKISGKWMY